MFDHEMDELASRQHGCFSRHQAHERGVTDDAIRHHLGSRRWVSRHPGVYAVHWWPQTWMQRLWAAHLDVGPASAVSHGAAAGVHRVHLFPQGSVVLTTLHGDHERTDPGYRTYQSTDLRAEHVQIVEGLPVTTPARTLIDLARVPGAAGRLDLAIQQAHVDGMCSIGEVQAMYDSLRRRGKPGMARLGTILGALGDGPVPTDSAMERRLLQVLAPLPWTPETQRSFRWRSGASDRVDVVFTHPRLVIVEADGRRWHSRVDQMANDRRRDREAQNHGAAVFRFVWEEIRHEPDMIREAIRIAMRRAA